MQRRHVYLRLTAALILFLSANVVCAQDQNLLPKYGPTPKSEALQAADATFLSTMDKLYHGDRTKGSEDLALRGWQYLSQHDLEDAMRRFNQAWLLNGRNGTAIWGMAAVEGSLGKLDDSLKLFAEADTLIHDNLNFSVDYAKAVGMTGAKRNDDALLSDAFGRFENIYQKAPLNTDNLQNWAITLYGIGKYSEAWEKVKLAEATPNKGALDPRFITALQSRMPRPQN
jgi:tetratricopeptide (TPR) repeat protein